ncbi:hypothetical protein RHMOL_Rhmol07G0290700 [Rhododendron molle]|uniref:Uncharacterized protein n=1 Tax=Rhododendron molle TaxID=49168 RepID=A0ACC0N645_RHOML|nr:hypothetical protein RHMOL_Rhmol07G0290700 [Rhododendron molle]
MHLLGSIARKIDFDLKINRLQQRSDNLGFSLYCSPESFGFGDLGFSPTKKRRKAGFLSTVRRNQAFNNERHGSGSGDLDLEWRNIALPKWVICRLLLQEESHQSYSPREIPSIQNSKRKTEKPEENGIWLRAEAFICQESLITGYSNESNLGVPENQIVGGKNSVFLRFFIGENPSRRTPPFFISSPDPDRHQRTVEARGRNPDPQTSVAVD